MKKHILTLTLTMTILLSHLCADASGNNLIYLGSWDQEVSKIQNSLSYKGYFSHEVTGYYGTITEKAVKKFQSDNGLASDGIVGPKTRSALYSEFTEGDTYWLARIVHAEAQGESYAGKLAVANCVLNRVRSREYPNTIYEVIFDKKHGVQYQPTINGAIYNSPSSEAMKAAKSAVNGNNNVGKSMFFFNPKKSTSNWISKNRTYYTTIGNHKFYL